MVMPWNNTSRCRFGTFEELERRCLLAVDYWVEPMRDVHQNFSGEEGTVARFGDSITESQAFFTQLQYRHVEVSEPADEALSWLQSYIDVGRLCPT